MVEVEKDPVELLVGQLAAVGLPLDRPLWQVHLVEDYYDTVSFLLREMYLLLYYQWRSNFRQAFTYIG